MDQFQLYTVMGKFENHCYYILNKIKSFSTEATAGVYWQNAAETWVDIYNPDADKNVLSSIVNMVSGSGPRDPLTANFMSESGVIDAFILLGPRPNDAFKQYTDLTGVAPLPQVRFLRLNCFIILS